MIHYLMQVLIQNHERMMYTIEASSQLHNARLIIYLYRLGIGTYKIHIIFLNNNKFLLRTI